MMKRLPKLISVLVLAVFLAYPMLIRAENVLPQGGVVTAGSADFDYASHPGTLNIGVGAAQNIANWQSYSVGAGNAVNYNRGSSFTFLNRVVGSNASNIFGAINAPNGKIFLINQNGILFAPGSSVNVAGLVASTLDITDDNFKHGIYKFNKSSKGGSVVNQGRISAPGGYVALLGSTVENVWDGVIEANLGTVVLASGEEVEILNLDSGGVISVVIGKATSENLGQDAAVKNSGQITANGGKVILTAKVLNGVFDKAVNSEGVINATSFSSHDGVVELRADGAEIRVSGSTTASKVIVDAKHAGFTFQSQMTAQESIDVTADGDIYLQFGSLGVNSPAGGRISLDGLNVRFGTATVMADLGDVSVNARGQIVSLWGAFIENGSNPVHIIAENLDLSAVNGIGTTGPIITYVSNLNAFNSAHGKIDLINARSFNAKSVINNGGALGDDIILRTTQGIARDIEVGNVTAAGLGNVAIDASGSITDNNADSMIIANKLSLTANQAIGSITNRINTNVNDISGLASRDPHLTSDCGLVFPESIGDIYINQGKAVTLSDLRNNNGLIDVIAAGKINAANVITLGGTDHSITLKTTSGDIEVGKINAASGAADVNLTSAASITDNNGDSLVTANNFNFTSGNVVGTPAGVAIQIASGHVVLNIQNQSGFAAYNIYRRNTIIDPWQLVAGNYAATGGETTQWTDPAAMGAEAYYKVEISTAASSAVGSATNRINTDVNNINGLSKAGPGDIYLNQAKAVTLTSLHNDNGLIDVIAGGAMNAVDVSTTGGASDSITLKTTAGDINATNINAAGDVILNSVNGSILGIGGGIHVTSVGDTHLTAGNLIGSWSPYSPLNVDVGKDLYLAIGKRDSTATGSVGSMPVSGSLGGTVGGVYHFEPGDRFFDPGTGAFTGNPPGYIFLNKTEIWPLGPALPPTPTPTPTPTPDSRILQQLSLDPRLQKIYDEDFRTVIIDRVTTTGVYYYHPLTLSDSTAFDDIALDVGAYDFIDGKVDLKGGGTLSPFYQEDVKKKK